VSWGAFLQARVVVGGYGGAVGYIGFDGNMAVAIAIRTIVMLGIKSDGFY